MIIQHIKHPFHHTIIYDLFDDVELEQIHLEVESYINKQPALNTPLDVDTHHARLSADNKTIAFSLDELHANDRNASNILKLVTKVYDINARGLLKDNPFSGFIGTSNADTTFMQFYKDGSSYFEHVDGAVLTFLYPFRGASEGGELVFTDYEYTPYLKDNCCVIFPSFEHHRLAPVKSKQKDVVRFSINQRIFIRNV